MPSWEIIAKYLSGEAAASERIELENWLKADPANHTVLRELQKGMRPEKNDAPDFEEFVQQDWNLVTQKINSRNAKHITLPSKNGWYKMAAAVLLLAVVGIGTWLSVGLTPWSDQAQQFVALDSVQIISLKDGSKIWLNKNSKLIVSANFGGQYRRISLEGEAYFEVAKDKKRPFIISTGDVITQVLGTSFNIDYETDKSVAITVVEGEVSVSTKDQSVILTKSESGNYLQKSNSLIEKQNGNLNFLTWKTGIIRFDSESLPNVCEFLSGYYSKKVQLGSKNLEKQSITTVLDNLTADEALSVIATTLDLKITKTDSGFFLNE